MRQAIPSLLPRLAPVLTALALAGCSAAPAVEAPVSEGEATHPRADRHAVAPGDSTPDDGAAIPFPGELEWIGETALPVGGTFEETVVGGLSGLTFDAANGVYYAISDDRADRSPARFYHLDIDLSDGRLDDGDFTVTGVTFLTDADGKPFATGSVDPEGIALASDGSLWISSEGDASEGVPPFVRRFAADGRQLAELALPAAYLPGTTAAGQRIGVRDNLALEALTMQPDRRQLWIGSENALEQDGPAADVGQGSLSRLSRVELSGDEPRVVAQYLYPVEPVAAPPAEPDGHRTNGLVELLALGDDHFLAMERSYSAGVGTTVRLWRFDLAAADELPLDSPGLARLAGEPPRPVSKRLLLDLTTLGTYLDNLEGLALGPRLPDGRRSLLLISDNNFRLVQRTQLLAFAWDDRTPTIARIQGAAHRSPRQGRWVYGVEGLVTAVDPDGRATVDRSPGFWLQSGTDDGDPATSEALHAFGRAAAETLPETLATGDRVRLEGRVVESAPPPGDDGNDEGRGGPLPLTQLDTLHVEIVERGLPLPAAVLLLPASADGEAAAETAGSEVRRLPLAIDDDGMSSFEPATDAIDLWESLEGMRVALTAPLVVGPTASWGGLALLPAEADGAAAAVGLQLPRTPPGGLLLTAEHDDELGPWSQAVQVDPMLIGGPRAVPQARVGERLAGAGEDGAEEDGAAAQRVVGVVSYGFGSYRVLLTETLPAATGGPVRRHLAPPAADPDRLTIATYNAYNLSPARGAQRFEQLARSIVDDLGAPDLVGLQEMQDESGPEDDGTVSAAGTFERLIEAIVAAGGPRYEYRQIDPADGTSGGQPGGNIRVGLLANPERVTLIDRQPAGEAEQPAEQPDGQPEPAEHQLRVRRDPRGPYIVPSPGLIDPDARCPDGSSAFRDSRKPLAVEVEFQRQRLFVIVNHLSSKGGDDPLFGARQPPERRSEDGRTCQAAVAAAAVRTLLAADRQARIVVLGDLNELPWRRPLTALARARLTDLVELVPAEQRYSYIFSGVSQLLDHVLVSPSLVPGAEAIIRHVNADSPAWQRASDHDPVLVRLQVPDTAPEPGVEIEPEQQAKN